MTGIDINELDATLRAHYVMEVQCDHERKRDRVLCSCSMVDLGWHENVGAAIQSWSDHVLAQLRGRYSMDAALRRADVFDDALATASEEGEAGEPYESFVAGEGANLDAPLPGEERR